MLSMGTELSRAFWIFVRSVAFESGSPPPDLAATSISRHRRAKSLPRAASAAPFLCLIECHFECPLMIPAPGGSAAGRFAPADTFSGRRRKRRLLPRSQPGARPDRLDARSCRCSQKGLVDAEVAGELRVERTDPHRSRPAQDRMAVVLGEHLDRGPDGDDDRGPDED